MQDIHPRRKLGAGIRGNHIEDEAIGYCRDRPFQANIPPQDRDNRGIQRLRPQTPTLDAPTLTVVISATLRNPAKDNIMTNPTQKAQRGLRLLEEAVLDLLKDAHPSAMKATQVRDALGIKDPRRGYNNYLTDSIIKRLEEKGLVVQTRDRGPWRLA